MKKWVVEDWGFYIQRSERKIRNGYLVFALTHFVRMIVRIAHIIANCLAFCLGKNLAKASAKHLCLNYLYSIYVQAI